MKNKLSILSICSFVMAFLSISGNVSAKDETGVKHRLKIVASFYPMYIMAKNVARGVPGVSVQELASPASGCLHDYALTSRDMKRLSDAQVLVANGAGMESFLDKAIAQLPNLKVIQLAQGISGVNPHVWVSMSNAITQVGNLGRFLEEVDPEYKDIYQKSTADYVEKLKALGDKMHAELAPYQGKEIITFHEAFSYFAQEFKLNVVAVIEREPGSEPSAKELAENIALIKKKNIPVLFSEPQYPDTTARIIAKETGAKVYILDPAVTGPDDYDAYINIMENNLKTLKEAFNA